MTRTSANIFYNIRLAVYWCGYVLLMLVFIASFNLPSKSYPLLIFLVSLLCFGNALLCVSILHNYAYQYTCIQYLILGCAEVTLAGLLWVVVPATSFIYSFMGLLGSVAFGGGVGIDTYRKIIPKILGLASVPSIGLVQPDRLLGFSPELQQVVVRYLFLTRVPFNIIGLVIFIIATVIGASIYHMQGNQQSLQYFLWIAGIGVVLSFVGMQAGEKHWQRWVVRQNFDPEELQKVAEIAKLNLPNSLDDEPI